MLHHFQSFSVCDGFLVFPCLSKLVIFLKNIGQVFCRISLNLGFSDGLSWLDWEYAFWARISQVLCSSQCTISGYNILMHLIFVMLTWITWVRYCLPNFCIVKLLSLLLLLISWVGTLRVPVSLHIFAHQFNIHGYSLKQLLHYNQSCVPVV